MIVVICQKNQKEIIAKALAGSDACLFEYCEKSDFPECIDCVRGKIKWIPRDDEYYPLMAARIDSAQQMIENKQEQEYADYVIHDLLSDIRQQFFSGDAL